MTGFPGLGSPTNPIPGELGENDASTIDDGIRVIVKALRDYGVHVISGPLNSRPSASAATLGRFHVTTDTTPRRVSVDAGTGWLTVAVLDGRGVFSSVDSSDRVAASQKDGAGGETVIGDAGDGRGALWAKNNAGTGFLYIRRRGGADVWEALQPFDGLDGLRSRGVDVVTDDDPRVNAPDGALIRTTPQTYASATPGLVSFTSSERDQSFTDQAQWRPDQDPARFVCQRSGLFLLTAHARWAGGSETAAQADILRLGDGGYVYAAQTSQLPTSLAERDVNFTALGYVSAGQVVGLRLAQGSGGNLDLKFARLSWRWMNA